LIDEQAAIAIARDYIMAQQIDVDRFEEARFLLDEKVWSCLFANKVPDDGVHSPGMTIVDVDALTGAASFFETM
jgi:hypothetical protein